MRKDFTGFGFNPKESDNHFFVVISEDKRKPVQIYERFAWDEEGEQAIRKADVLKLRISRYKWSRVVSSVAQEFNSRLKEEKHPVGKFVIGGTPVEKRMGKELMVLLWGIENNDPSGIPTAIRNWLGLRPEERWWLYTMTNASTGGLGDKKGWRMALRYALCENPVEESKQMLIEEFTGEELS